MDVDDLGTKNVADLDNLGTAFGVRCEFYHEQFPFNCLAPFEIDHPNHVHELVELFQDLIQHLVVSNSNHGNAGQRAIVGRCNIEGMNVETPAAKHAGNASQHAEFIFNQDRYGVSHVDLSGMVGEDGLEPPTYWV